MAKANKQEEELNKAEEEKQRKEAEARKQKLEQVSLNYNLKKKNFEVIFIVLY